MDVNSMLSNGARDATGSVDGRRGSHQYPTRQTEGSHEQMHNVRSYGNSSQRSVRGSIAATTGPTGYPRTSPAKKDQKHMVFQLIDPEDPRIQARLPMRVMISQHDTTDSIITTVKNFYGLYDFGVSFENKEGFSIIAAYDNFENDMTVYVRTVAQPLSLAGDAHDSASPKKPSLGAPFEMRPPQHSHANSPSRSAIRSAGLRSMSPQSDYGRRSMSAAPGGKPRNLRTKSKDPSIVGDGDGYSSGDNGEGSVTSSRRSKTEQVNAEISVDNIVEGGRRKRAFESSELPLFVPPQVPMSASISSISPQRRAGPPGIASPYAHSNQQTFSYTQPLPSPQSYGSATNFPKSGVSGNGYSVPYEQPGRQLRGRSSGISYSSARHSSGGIMPTPDPTVGSVISDEDVALQLMRLGDPTAFSHGRTSTSTVDDALSGKAEAASSDDEDDDQEEVTSSRLPAVPRFNDVGPQRKRQRVQNEQASDGTSGEEYDDHHDQSFNSDDVRMSAEDRRSSKSTKPNKPRNPLDANNMHNKPRANSMGKPKHKPHTLHSTFTTTTTSTKVPMSPSSLPAQSRKASIASINFQHQLGVDEEDLSSKPRCQRCRKSKKGCDRQRPCGRCKDAGIGIEGCQSEDEGNGRKGRYGRHMGVPIKKGEEGYVEPGGEVTAGGVLSGLPGGGAGLGGAGSVPANGYFLAPALPDKSKKRKR